MLEMMTGRVDETKHGHFVGTVFFAFIGPLFPLRSMYVVREDISRHGNTTTMRWEGVDLPLQWRSVALAYLRIWPAILAFVIPVAMMWGERVELARPEWLITVGLLALSLVMTLVPGKLRGERARQVEVLEQATGLALEPAALDVVQRSGRADALAHTLEQARIACDDPSRFADVLGRDAEPHLATAYALARYRAVGDRAWAPAATAVWARLSAR